MRCLSSRTFSIATRCYYICLYHKKRFSLSRLTLNRGHFEVKKACINYIYFWPNAQKKKELSDKNGDFPENQSLVIMNKINTLQRKILSDKTQKTLILQYLTWPQPHFFALKKRRRLLRKKSIFLPNSLQASMTVT